LRCAWKKEKPYINYISLQYFSEHETLRLARRYICIFAIKHAYITWRNAAFASEESGAARRDMIVFSPKSPPANLHQNENTTRARPMELSTNDEGSLKNS
jgi:hypothetical protein